MNSNENEYLVLIEKLKEVKSLIKNENDYDYIQLEKIINILGDNEKNKDEKLMEDVRNFLSEANFFNARWGFEWLMPIKGMDYVIELKKLCDQTLRKNEKSKDFGVERGSEEDGQYKL